MIKVSIGQTPIDMEIKKFPNGEQNLQIHNTELIKASKDATVSWFYKGDEEFLTLLFVVKKLQSLNPETQISLNVPYLPYSRMDRTQTEEQFFTLSYFLDALVSLGLKEIVTMDVHSPRTSDLLQGKVQFINKTIAPQLLHAALKKHHSDDIVVVFPDETAHERLSSYIGNLPFVVIKKQRDFATGKLTGFEVENLNGINMTDKVLIMMDDLCSYGGTFLGAYEAILKEGYLPEGFCLLVTHLESSVLSGSLIQSKDLLGIWFAPTMDWSVQGKENIYSSKLFPI